uniref:tRNA (guanine(9)-N(1))-methyltransferase n=1 Tax=Dunaliella tertiolecta TaxID=3047 RepID=A0A7S3QW01_DUNTE|mmetsp:Transcript_22811/g.63055  ORF Transcript_22811/g.63055 Transcript_22811/m.63055 type:complete len:478 (+) Transcript_22811:1512-2945(+)|eukprot:CAMPEP_0202357082 /NCGR_PEP_ID=MMETSP1126-20121109/11258_1 /ASSEMBLY_ACC=CAM_ASM_000457 /TAXON_ID=3047 /ORGANISM="Dunaliella tertiolecta, Strain CCMP1320" /LENGTH=477 /DNA_ID=CAMNT_0048949905 /DNA_START=69 /DNA_END=1502 /DNA_ORIENTATION=+
MEAPTQQQAATATDHQQNACADANVADPTTTRPAQQAGQEAAEPQKPMSKNQAKKQAKLERLAQKRLEQRAEEKARRQREKEERQKQLEASLVNMTEEERAARREGHQARLAARRQAVQERDERRAKALAEGNFRIVIDMDFNGIMPDNDQRHLCSQLGFAYSAVTRSPRPPHLHLLGLNGELKEKAHKQISGLSNWRVTQSELGVAEFFAGRIDEVVYLTADSPHTLEVLDPTKAYVIGGLVDHNRLKNVCLNRAKEAGMATAKLPIQGNVNLSMSSVLTVNHMVEILVNFIARGNTASEWGPVLNEVLPMRKRAGFQKGKLSGGRATPESQTAQGDRGDKQQLGEQGQPGGQGQQQKSGEQQLRTNDRPSQVKDGPQTAQIQQQQQQQQESPAERVQQEEGEGQQGNLQPRQQQTLSENEQQLQKQQQEHEGNQELQGMPQKRKADAPLDTSGVGESPVNSTGVEGQALKRQHQE